VSNYKKSVIKTYRGALQFRHVGKQTSAAGAILKILPQTTTPGPGCTPTIVCGHFVGLGGPTNADSAELLQRSTETLLHVSVEVIKQPFAAAVVRFRGGLRNKATYEKSHQYTEGIQLVIVNGQFVFANNAKTAARLGQVFSGPAKQ
jgi:hypothetical protein